MNSVKMPASYASSHCVGHRREDLVAHAAVAPVGDDLLLIYLDAVVGNGIACFRPRIENSQVFEAVAGQFRIGGHGLGLRAALADDQLIIAQVDRFVLAQIVERSRPHHRHGVFSVVGLIEVGDQRGPLGGNRGRGVEALHPQFGNSFVHEY